MGNGDILLVSGDQEQRTLLPAALAEQEYAVKTAADAETALRMVYTFLPDLIISDVDLPLMDGYELCRKIRAIPRLETIPFVFISSEGKSGQETLKGLQCGADDFVNKPVIPDEVVLRVDVILKRLRILRKLTITDEITGLYNRRYFDQRLDEEMERLKRYNRPLAVFLVDVDRFKEVNDTWGHTAGDEVLRSVAREIENNLRRSDLVARFGGDEFAVIMPEHVESAVVSTAERLRVSVAEKQIGLSNGDTVSVTISLGGMWLSENDPMTSSEIIRKVDLALYEAKEQGRNTSVLHTATP